MNYRPRRWTRWDLRVSQRTYPTTKEQIRKRTVTFRHDMSRISAVMIAVAARRGARSIDTTLITALRHLWPTRKVFPQFGFEILVSLNKKYQSAVDYCSYRFIYKCYQNNEDVVSEMEKMHNKLDFPMEYQAFSWQESTSVINFLTAI